MKITFLGTNGWYDTPTGNTICILITTKDHDIILDAGNGIYKADRYVDGSRPVYLFLSHFHLDHITGLHILGKFRFNKGLYICGQAGTKGILDSIIAHPFSMPLSMLPYETKIIELPRDAEQAPFSMSTLPLVHASPTIGFRFEIDGCIVAYCPDTGYCENAVELARKADLVITECAFPAGRESDVWPHLNPESAARIARDAGAGRLGLVHFDASLYRTEASRREAEKAARLIFPDTFSAFDDMMIEVQAGGVRDT
ncbi:MAG: MBL fold metallo-hydrolase [Nitrospiraceae bacterium]|nr:MBL fold metallo-hydrolase [Nitrospiraceae bacterium]